MTKETQIAAAALLLAAGLAAPAAANRQTDIAELRAEIADLRRDYESRLAELERRLASLEEAQAPAAPAESDLERLRRAAREVAAEASEPAAPAVGRERNLNRLNPEISFTGTVLGVTSDVGREEFSLQEFELDLQAALDPFSRTRWTIAFGEEGVEVEEGYVMYSSLPGGLELTAGKFRQRFGALNRQHLHALPQSTYPLALATFFGEEGLAQTGVSFSWLLPRPWATANEISLQVTSGENEEAFGGELFEDLAVLARLKNFWELSDATYFEWGLSGVTGKTAAGGDSHLFGTDLTLNWQPPARAKYRALTWRAELLRSERDDESGVRREAWGGYTYLEGLFRQNLWAGLRAEYGFLEDELTDESENRFALQLTWAAGPHKHETY